MLDALDDVSDHNLGFDEVIVDTEGFGAFFVGFLAEGGQHDDLEVGGFRGITEDVEDVEAADFGHHNIEEDQFWLVRKGGGEGVFPVGDAANVEAFGLEAGYVNIGEGVIVLD